MNMTVRMWDVECFDRNSVQGCYNCSKQHSQCGDMVSPCSILNHIEIAISDKARQPFSMSFSHILLFA
jgi:hypothetical protein